MTERIDVLDRDGRATGATKTKADIHRDGDWHRAAHVWIAAPDGRVLFQRRSPEKENWPDLWDVSAAGHLSAGETSVDAAIRECFEEIGLRITPDEFEFLGTMNESAVLHDGDYVDNEIHDIFLVRRVVDPAALTLDPAEVAAVVLAEEWPAPRVPHGDEYALLRSALARR